MESVISTKFLLDMIFLKFKSTLKHEIMYDNIKIIKKFAYLPIIVPTWRRIPTKALIWMQTYYVKNNKKYCLHLGMFSYEF